MTSYWDNYFLNNVVLRSIVPVTIKLDLFGMYQNLLQV